MNGVINLLDYDKPEYPTLIAIVAVGIDSYLKIIQFENAEVANPGIHECYCDNYFWHDIDFEDSPGLYRASLSVNDTSVNTPDGMEYDCEPNIKLTHKFNFELKQWDTYNGT